MPRHRAPMKRMRQDKIKRVRNRSLKSAVKTAAKKVRLAATPEDAAKMVPEAASIIDRAAKKRVIHWRTAARLKSRLARRGRAAKA
ncbi:MAG TPA: 30S ribosomal protein S20 [bacterium]|nr:30S ribosomal protein S20 [bacterium]